MRCFPQLFSLPSRRFRCRRRRRRYVRPAPTRRNAIVSKIVRSVATSCATSVAIVVTIVPTVATARQTLAIAVRIGATAPRTTDRCLTNRPRCRVAPGAIALCRTMAQRVKAGKLRDAAGLPSGIAADGEVASDAGSADCTAGVTAVMASCAMEVRSGTPSPVPANRRLTPRSLPVHRLTRERSRVTTTAATAAPLIRTKAVADHAKADDPTLPSQFTTDACTKPLPRDDRSIERQPWRARSIGCRPLYRTANAREAREWIFGTRRGTV